MLAILDATARADVGADIGNHTALGIFFRLQVVEFDIRFLFLVLLVLHVCYLSFVGLFVHCVLSVTPNSNRCPSGIPGGKLCTAGLGTLVIGLGIAGTG